MFNINGIKVFHKKFGNGNISSQNNSILTVKFKDGERKFQYPKIFTDGFLSTEDGQLNEIILKDSLQIKQEQEEREKSKDTQVSAIMERKLTHSRKGGKCPHRNIAFKCNYCDGGNTTQRLGYNGVCSDVIIAHNIETAKRPWCSNEESPCMQYWNHEITRQELLEAMGVETDQDSYICYESQMLKNWRAFAGVINSGKRKGEPMHLENVKLNSLAILTTRLPNTEEKDRIIFAVFLVTDTFEGDASMAGYVALEPGSPYRLELTPTEAQKIKYWKYHANESKPEKPAWGTGLHRYIEDEEAAMILRDIAELRKCTRTEKQSQRFFQYYCKVNGIDATIIKNPSGALNK